jgi:hypothetical protein
VFGALGFEMDFVKHEHVMFNGIKLSYAQHKTFVQLGHGALIPQIKQTRHNIFDDHSGLGATMVNSGRRLAWVRPNVTGFGGSVIKGLLPCCPRGNIKVKLAVDREFVLEAHQQ